MRYWSALLGIVMLIIAVIFITMYGISSLSVLENVVNMSGNPYQAQWNATTSSAIASISIMQLLPYILIATAIVLSISFFAIIALNRRRW